MYLLNIDKPTLKCTIHLDGCSWKPREEPKYKGFGKLKRYGGWLSFKTDDEVESYYRGKWQYKGYRWVRCSYCRP